MARLHVPDVTELDTLAAALACAEADWYVGPLANGSKHPGSRLGKGWQQKTSRDPEVIVAWFAGSDDGLFLHCGRSGAVVFDVDYPELLPGVLLQAIEDTMPPYQSTRADQPGRGHFVFAQPPGRTLGNGLGKLPGDWGEIRGANGVIVVQPTRHEKCDAGGRYMWIRVGNVPVLPAPVADQLHDSSPGEDAASDAEVLAFLDRHTGASRPELLDVWIASFQQKTAAGESRHVRMISICAGAMAEARAGYFPARLAMERLEAEFLAAVTQPGHGQQGKARTPGMAASEWMGISAWAVAQAHAADLDDVRTRVEEKVPDQTAWIDDSQPKIVQPQANPRRYIHPKQGLLAATLAADVMGLGPLATGIDDIAWSYANGVWSPDKHIVVGRVAQLLGEKHRRTYPGAVEDHVRRNVPAIASEPVSEYINLRNGLLDWRTGELRPHSPDVPSTVQLNTNWDPGAVCPEFDKFLASVVPTDMVDVVWELIGYLVYSGNPLHKAVMLMGRGRNGKGTLLRLLVALLGKRNITSVSLHDLVNTRFAPASLFGKLANIAGDIDGTYLESTATFKAITGQDTISAEHKGRDRFDFTPWAVPMFSANKIPASADTTVGYLSRWLVLPFPHDFTGREDRHLDAKLQTPDELRGIVAKAVPALRWLLERGDFELTESGKAAYDEFARRVDQVRTWFHESCHFDPDTAFIARTALYSDYRTWIDEGGGKSLKRSEFYDRVEALCAEPDTGADPITVHGARGFRGIALGSSG